MGIPLNVEIYIQPNTLSNVTFWNETTQIYPDGDGGTISGEYIVYSIRTPSSNVTLKADGYEDLTIQVIEGDDNYATMEPVKNYISSITHKGTTYTIKDAEAREDIATKQDALPSQSGQSGKFLTTNGSTISWAAVDALPSQTGQNGKILTTNGTNASWGTISIPTVNNSTITIQKNSTTIDSFTTNQSSNKTINISISKSDVGLENVDNTSDTNKPISTATQTALDNKANKTNIINGVPLSNTASYFYGTSSTAAATAQKEVSIPSITTLNAGQMIIVQPTITSTVADSTIKLNNFTAYPMRYNNAAITTSTDSVVWNLNYPSFWVFDGTYWVFAGHGLDSNTTYTLNYSVDAGKYTAGSGSYAVTRYSIIGQKANGTWEKITSTSANYSTGTSKTVNTNGFVLNQLRYYGTTTNVANGAKIATNVMYEKSASVDMRYSTNCGGTTTWAEGDYIYLVGTIGNDGLFYLDTTTWWTNALPSTNNGKLYIRLGLALAASGYTMSFFEDRPIFYHDGTKICEYKVADNKQDNLPSQSGNSGKFLTTDGTTMSWATVSSGGANVLFFTNVVASDWVTDNTYAEYEYKCVLTCTGVSENDYAQVVFNPTQSISGNYANICLTGTNSVTIYSKINTAISIPTITIFGSN